MSAALDMSLDDIIKNINNKKSGSANSRGRSRGSGSGSGPGPARRFPNRAANRAAPYTIGQDIPVTLRWSTTKAPETAWQHDMYADQPVHAAAYPGQAGRASSIETGTKLYVSNLDYGVSDEDIKELFSEFGDLKRHTVHYDRSGRSKGTAEVVFSRRADAVAAVKRYNNVQLDGKPMKVEIVGTNIATHAVAPAANVGFGNSNAVPRSGLGRSGALGRPRGGGGGRGRGIRRGRGRGRARGEKVSAEDLDADLEKYHAEAMQLN